MLRRKIIILISILFLVNTVASAQQMTYSADSTNSDVTATYAEAQGTNGLVSVDVPLKVTIPQKLVLALDDGNTIANHRLFNGQTLPSWDVSNFEINFDGEADPSFPGRTNEKIRIYGLLYTNTENISLLVELNNNQLVNQDDPDSTVDMQCSYRIKSLDNSFVSNWEYITDTGNNNLLINSTDLKNSDNVGKLSIECWGVYNTFINDAARSGDYIGALTITASML